MISMSIRNAKMNFSRMLALVQRGEDIIIRNRQEPIAKISSFRQEKSKDLPAFLESLSKIRSLQKQAPQGHLEKCIREDRDGRD